MATKRFNGKSPDLDKERVLMHPVYLFYIGMQEGGIDEVKVTPKVWERASELQVELKDAIKDEYALIIEGRDNEVKLLDEKVDNLKWDVEERKNELEDAKDELKAEKEGVKKLPKDEQPTYDSSIKILKGNVEEAEKALKLTSQDYELANADLLKERELLRWLKTSHTEKQKLLFILNFKDNYDTVYKWDGDKDNTFEKDAKLMLDEINECCPSAIVTEEEKAAMGNLFEQQEDKKMEDKKVITLKKSTKFEGGYTGIKKGTTLFLNDYNYDAKENRVEVQGVSRIGSKLRQDTHYMDIDEFNEVRERAGLQKINPKKKKTNAPKRDLAKKKVEKTLTKKDARNLVRGLTRTGQTKRGKAQDKKVKAKKAGRRVSKSGKVYYEYRENRADGDRRKKL